MKDTKPNEPRHSSAPPSHASTATADPCTAPSLAAANDSALSVPAADGINAFGQSKPTRLSLRRGDNPAAPRCECCGEIPAADDLWPVETNEIDIALVCSIRCMMAMLVPQAHNRAEFLTAWDSLRNKQQLDGRMTPANRADCADLQIIGQLIEAEEKIHREREGTE